MSKADIERAAAEGPGPVIDHRRRLEGRARRLAADDGTGHATVRQRCSRFVSTARMGLSGAHQCGFSRLHQGARALADPRLRGVQNVRTMSAHRDRLLRPPDLVSRCSGVPEREVGQFLTSSLEEQGFGMEKKT
jgi:hypothetical protein